MKQSKALKGKKQTLESNAKRSKTMKGKKPYIMTKKTRYKMSLAKKGQKSYRKGMTNVEYYGAEKAEEIRIKNSRAHKGQTPLTAFKKGNVSWNKDLTKETDLRVKKNGKNSGKARKGKYDGEKCWNWQGGKSFEPYGLEFNNTLKEQIRKRDGYRCQECFRHQSELRTKTNRKYKLTIHHIDYDKKNNNPENLISLCKSCHGQTNFKRNDWEEYFKSSRI